MENSTHLRKLLIHPWGLIVPGVVAICQTYLQQMLAKKTGDWNLTASLEHGQKAYGIEN